MHSEPSISDDFLNPSVPSWVGAIGDLLDHYHGYRWEGRAVPNNYIFYVRDHSRQLKPVALTDSIHMRYELVIALGGKCRVCLEETFYPLAPGQALLVKPGEFHRYFGADPFVMLLFGFDLDDCSELCLNGSPARQLSGEDMALLCETGELQSTHPTKDATIFTIAMNMNRLLGALKSRPAIAPAAEEGDDEHNTRTMLREVARFVDRRLDRGLRITDIAKQMRISESNLRKLFRERFGVSLGSYLQRSRLLRSIQLIRRVELSISEIGQLCGFESIHSFSQVFSRAMGMSPSAYRRRLLEGGAPIKVGDEIPPPPARKALSRKGAGRVGPYPAP